jgi:Cu/Ag efflux pump CusA
VRGDIPGLEILNPMAIVAIGGLISATLVNLFIVPSMYLRFAPSARTRDVDEMQAIGVPAPGTAAD